MEEPSEVDLGPEISIFFAKGHFFERSPLGSNQFTTATTSVANTAAAAASRPRSLPLQNEALDVTETGMEAKKRRIGVGPREAVQVNLKQYFHDCGYS